MKQFVFSFFVFVAVMASWAVDDKPVSTEDQIRSFYVEYMRNVENNPDANGALVQRHMTPELIARLQGFVMEHGFDAVINAQDVSDYGIQSLKVIPVEEDCYFVSYKWDGDSEPTMICVKAVGGSGVLKISDIIPLPLEE